MTQVDLNNLSPKALDFEIGGSKQCLENHGVNSLDIFAVVHGDAWNNPVVIDAISKYYGFANNGLLIQCFYIVMAMVVVNRLIADHMMTMGF
jgi:hypothetical protein